MSLVMRKPAFCICENKDADQFARLIIAFVFTTGIVQSFFFLNPKFQASSHLLWLYSPVCVGPGQKHPKTGFLTTRPILVLIVTIPGHCSSLTLQAIYNSCDKYVEIITCLLPVFYSLVFLVLKTHY